MKHIVNYKMVVCYNLNNGNSSNRRILNQKLENLGFEPVANIDTLWEKILDKRFGENEVFESFRRERDSVISKLESLAIFPATINIKIYLSVNEREEFIIPDRD